jgi:putative flavoprotein involved in K+ transport
MNKRQLMTVIIGGGQAGLATAYHLSRRDVPCVILDENDKVGAAWRKRWESLRLFTPGRYDSLPGMPYPGPPGSYPGKDDIANYLEAYASAFGFSVRTSVKVVRLKAEDGNYILETNEGLISASNVVVATGPFHHPRIPDYADKLNRNIYQIHSSEYQTPSQIPDGSVLIAGAGQSGAEIALDMAHNGHKVWLSGRDPGEEPTVRGTFSDRLFTPVMVFAATKLFNVANPLGRMLRKRFFYPPRGIPRAGGTTKRLRQAGIEFVGRTAGINEGYPQLEDGRVLKVNSVIWCTGFVMDFSWIELPIFDEYGFPITHRGVVSSHQGLYFIGLPFQRTLSSSLIVGVGSDAAYIAGYIASG